MSDPIIRTRNYYSGIDPQHYYKNSAGDVLNIKAARATTYKDVHLSDLLNNETCGVTFWDYRDTDNKAAPVKSNIDLRSGIVRSYNPETNLVAVDCIKKLPSKLSVLFKRTNKMRYVEPSSMMVASVSNACKLRRVSKRASRASPKARASPKGSAGRNFSRGGKRNTRKKRQQLRK